MSSPLEERLAITRAAKQEKERVAQRLAEAVLQAVHTSQTAARASNYGSGLADMLGADLATSTAINLSEHVVHDGLRSQLSAAHFAIASFQRECRDVAPTVDGIDVTPIPGVLEMVARDLVWGTLSTLADAEGETQMLSSYVSTTTMSLRARGEQLDRGLVELERQRAAVLDPTRERL